MLLVERAEGGPLRSAGGCPEGGRLVGSGPSPGLEGAHSGGRQAQLPGERLSVQSSETLYLKAPLGCPQGRIRLPLTPANSAPFARGGHSLKGSSVNRKKKKKTPKPNKKPPGYAGRKGHCKFRLPPLARRELACKKRERGTETPGPGNPRQ